MQRRTDSLRSWQRDVCDADINEVTGLQQCPEIFRFGPGDVRRGQQAVDLTKLHPRLSGAHRRYQPVHVAAGLDWLVPIWLYIRGDGLSQIKDVLQMASPPMTMLVGGEAV